MFGWILILLIVLLVLIVFSGINIFKVFTSKVTWLIDKIKELYIAWKEK